MILVILGIGYWLISPFWRTTQVNEALPNMTEMSSTEETNKVVTLKQGTFTGFDKIHTGSGTASVIESDGKRYIRLEDDFVVQNGPDLYVGLGKNGVYTKGSELAKLKGTMGSQNYELPAGMNSNDIQEVWIWCKAFSTPFAKAVLIEKNNHVVPNDQIVVETYIRENIATLAPEDAVLGGTWYVTSVVVDSSLKTGTMSYEDGHIAGSATFSYRLEGATIILENIAKK